MNALKRISLPLTCVFLVTMLLSCSPAGLKVYTDPDQTISVNTGQEFIIALGENPTTGYTWQEEFDDSFLELVEWKYKPSPHAEGMVGVGGTKSLQFKALKEGETNVTLVCKQPWEGGGVGETVVFRVSIS